MEAETLDTIYLDQHSKSVFKHMSVRDGCPQKPQANSNADNICRICLEPCPQIKFCLCGGGMLTHEHCLTEFLNIKLKKYRLKLNQLRCEICSQTYEVQGTHSCTLSIKSCGRKILSNQVRCVIYALFFIIVFMFYGLMGYLFVNRPLTDIGRVVLIIIGVCLFMMFILFLGLWIYQFLLVIESQSIKRIVTLQERANRQLNASNASKSLKIHPITGSQSETQQQNAS